MASIYLTLGLARTLADAFRGNRIGDGLFIVCCLMVLIAVVTQGLSRRPRGIEIAIAIGVAACYLLVFVRMTVQTERSHLIEYGVVALLVYEAFKERAKNNRLSFSPALLAIITTSGLGIFDECLQWFVPGRFFDLDDILFNEIAALGAVGTSSLLAWARKRFAA